MAAIAIDRYLQNHEIGINKKLMLVESCFDGDTQVFVLKVFIKTQYCLPYLQWLFMQ